MFVHFFLTTVLYYTDWKLIFGMQKILGSNEKKGVKRISLIFKFELKVIACLKEEIAFDR